MEITMSSSSKMHMMDVQVFRAAEEGDMKTLERYDAEQVGTILLTPTNNTILHVYLNAQIKPSTQTVKLMLGKWPFLGSRANDKGETPLHIAARYGQIDTARLLISHAKSINPPSDQQDIESGIVHEEEEGNKRARQLMRRTNSDGDSALHEAVRHGHLQLVSLLVGEEEYEYIYPANRADESLLYMAAERGNLEIARIILAAFKAPACRGPNGRTAAHVAVIRGENEMVGAILEKEGLQYLTRRADDQGWTPLHYAAYNFSEMIVEMLLGYDKSAAYTGDKRGRTAVHIAVTRLGNLAVTNCILRECPEKYKLNKLFFDPRVDKMAFNNNQLSPFDLIPHNILEMIGPAETNSRNVGLRASKIEEDQNKDKKSEMKMIDSGNNTTARKEDEESDDDVEKLREVAKETHLIVGTLIATVTFAAGIAMPGGYNQEQGADIGVVVLSRSKAFKAFVISDTIALVLSCAAVFIYLVVAMNTNRKITEKMFSKALPLTLYAMLAMVIAFITGTYAVLPHQSTLANAASVLGCLFFVLYFYIFGSLISLKIGQGLMTCVACLCEILCCQGICPKAFKTRNIA